MKMASPAIAGYSSQMIVSVIDTAMVGRIENADIILASMGLGVLATWTLTSFLSSLSTGTHILIAHRFGESKHAELGDVLKHSLALTFGLGLIFGILFYWLSYPLMDLLAADVEVTKYSSEYMQYRAYGLPFFLMGISFRAFYYGIGSTKVFMYSALISYLVNIIFNYFLIFGNAGFPRMGVAGAGLASSIGMAVGLFVFLAFSYLPRYRIRYSLLRWPKFMAEEFLRIVRLSLPVSFQNILILFGFLLFVSITGLIGTVEQAATQVVITALYVSFMPCFGFGVAAQTLVGNALGNKQPQLAYIQALETTQLAIIFTSVIGFFFVGFTENTLSILTNNTIVIETATPILRLVGIAQVFYGAGIVLSSALQGAGETVFVMKLEIVTHWILFLPISYLLAVSTSFGLMGAWIAMPLYVIAYTGISYVKLRSGSWKKNRL